MERKNNEILHEYLIPILLQLIELLFCMLLFSFAIGKGSFVQAQELLEDEWTLPTLGRLVFVIVGFVAAIVLAHVSSKAYRKDNVFASFFIAVAGGTFLWQSLGEGVWHFSLLEVHMVQLESLTVLPLAVLALVVMFANMRHHYFDFGITTFYYSFMCNWMGHYVMLATYPVVENYLEEGTWFVISGCSSGVILLIYSIWLALRKASTRQERLHVSMLTYIALGLIAFAFIE